MFSLHPCSGSGRHSKLHRRTTLGVMDLAGLAVSSVVIALGAYSVWVALMIARADWYSPRQKAAQIAIIFLIPLIGALLCHALLRRHGAAIEKQDRQHVPNRADDVGTGPHMRGGDDA